VSGAGWTSPCGKASVAVGDCLDGLRAMDAGSARTCVTSPPYWGLRDYGVDGQLGLEPTPAEFVGAMVEVFREVRRVLTDDGTLWLNLGDSYAGSGRGGYAGGKSTLDGSVTGQEVARVAAMTQSRRQVDAPVPRSDVAVDGCKVKDLVGVPWMVAFALRADGWYLRQDIVWHKPNPMPESVTDRCTKAHEYVFLLSKSGRYFYDAEAVAEPAVWSAKMPDGWDTGEGGHGAFHRNGRERGRDLGAGGTTRNKRSVWTVATTPTQWDYCAACGTFYARGNGHLRTVGGSPACACGASDRWVDHFATFPPALIEPCILAGSAPGDTVLDPFTGSGTTGMVAVRHGRRFAGCELNPGYAAVSACRIGEEADHLFQGVTA